MVNYIFCVRLLIVCSFSYEDGQYQSLDEWNEQAVQTLTLFLFYNPLFRSDYSSNYSLMMKKLSLFQTFLIAVLTVSSCNDSSSNDEKNGPIPIGDEWIDPVFAEELQIRGYITSAATITPADVRHITKIDISGDYPGMGRIKSLRGIEYFTNLTYLACEWNRLTHLNISKNTKLETLYLNDNQLSNLDITKNTKLEILYCGNTGLTTLDTSHNTQLEVLDCGDNQLTKLDVTKNINLNKLFCYSNKLTSIDVSRNTKLEYLECGYNLLKNIDISKNIKLRELYCDINPGENGIFKVYVWFDNTSLPLHGEFSWKYSGKTVRVEFIKM